MDYKAVIFAFDYPLGDATDAIYAGFQAGMTALGQPVPDRETVRHTVGMVLEDAYTLLTGDESQEGRQTFRAEFSKVARPMQAAGTPLCAGARELLLALEAAGVPTAVVSTKHTGTLRDIFAGHGLADHFALILGGDLVSRNKPDPEGLNAALDRLGVAPAEALYCGDTVIDAQTAAAAGTRFCAVLNGTTPAEAFRDLPHVRIAPDLIDLRTFLGV